MSQGTPTIGRPADIVSGTPRRARRFELFRGITTAAAILVLIILGAIAIFLIVKSIPSLSKDQKNFFTTKVWNPDASPPLFGIAVLVFGTILSSIIALVVAVPVAVGVAIFIVEYAPKPIAKWLGYLTDMLATVPSVIYGLWGLYFLVPRLQGFQHWLATWFGWIPIFDDPNDRTSVASRSIFVASLVLAIMILPVIAAISREVLRQVDPGLREAALALGATRWELVRTALLPPSRPGIIGAIMLGLGRALGETIAIALILGTSFTVSIKILQPGGNTIAANIATYFGEAGTTGRSALIASGLVLFIMTLLVNTIARTVIYRAALRQGTAAR
jgi:phosphate transport system permease protein